jgi:hypothetical protein
MVVSAKSTGLPFILAVQGPQCVNAAPEVIGLIDLRDEIVTTAARLTAATCDLVCPPVNRSTGLVRRIRKIPSIPWIFVNKGDGAVDLKLIVRCY